MNLKHRFLSALMAFLMILGTLTTLSIFPIFAEEEAEEEEVEKETIDYHKDVFASREAKLATMTLKLERFGYQLYYEPYTGEVAVKNVATGDVLFTNPYDVGGVQASASLKNEFLSQIIIKYSNNEGNEATMFSYVEAAQRGQIKAKSIKNGIRVEYIIGKQEARMLMPMQIEKTRFEEKILANITDSRKLNLMKALYVEKNPFDPMLSEQDKKEMQKNYPITDTYAIYVIAADVSQRERNQLEAMIKEFCPAYTYEELEYDHNLVEYTSLDKNPVQFRLALEYYLDESGLSVRLPANGIRFDQSQLQLDFIRILPYMGAGSSEFTGYTMIPDGSGALVRFEDIMKTGSARLLTGSLYGHDYAYHTITGANQQVMRLPIFGLVEDTVHTETVIKPDESVGTDVGSSDAADPAPAEESAESDSADSSVDSEDTSTAPEVPVETITYRKKSGWVAIIEEGDALASITSAHGGNTYKYNSVYTEFNPRPKDSYNLASSISVAGNNTWTVVSDRKYTGSYRIRYIMLTDLEYAEKNGLDAAGCFDTSYVGMALAYRNELIRAGKLTKLNTQKDQIPLYLETLGVINVQDKVLSIPVTVKKPLTTFEDIKTITKELGEAGIHNLVYKLTGYINGGMSNTVANRIDVEKTAGDDAGLTDLFGYAKDEDLEIFLDMDFSYARKDTAFDGFSKKTQAVRTIDGRYTQKRTYSAVLQYFTSTGMIAISPSVFSDIFQSAQGDLSAIGVTGVSLGTIGSDLNSDFDEDDPYNREDSKQHVVKTLAKIREAGYSVMMEGGNAYAVPYANHVLKVALDSSNYTYASETIPLIGLVYHGYLNYAGNATNTAGDIRYETLKMLENGANPYFILVYRNAEKLKESVTLSQYFSISYENWKEDLIDTYRALNRALGPVMNATMVDHEFVIGERIPSEEEKLADEEQERLEAEEAERLEQEAAAESERLENLENHLSNKKPATKPEETEGDETTAVETSAPDSSEDESEEPEEDGYEYTKYTSDNGMIVKVTFENGYSFILNYNIFAVTVKETGDTAIPALGYLVLNDRGEVVVNSGEEAAA